MIRLGPLYVLGSLMPLIIPVLARALLASATGWLREVRDMQFVFLLYYALPYASFLLAGLLLMRRKSPTAWLRASLAAPLVFALWLWACLAGLHWASPQSTSAAELSWSQVVSGLLLVAAHGYAYVGLFHACRLALTRLRILKIETAR